MDDSADALPAEVAALRRALGDAERALVRAADREKVLKYEIQHRVRNMLSVIRSIFSRTAEASLSQEELTDHFRGRLDAVARFEALRGIDPLGHSDLEDMVRDELLSFEFDARITLEGPETIVADRVAQSLGLAIHELATNSIKYGALSSADRRARLQVRWSRRPGGLMLEWTEAGVSVLGAAPMRIGFGREFIEQALPYQIGATTAFELRPGGLHCTIEVPLP